MSERLPISIWRFPSASRPKAMHTVTLGANGVMTCSCERWQFTRDGQPRLCKHIEHVARDAGWDLEADGEYIYRSPGVDTFSQL